MEYRKATLTDLENIWAKDIAKHPGDERYVRWKSQYIENNLNGKCATFVVVDGEAGIEQINRRVMEKVTHLLLITDASKKGTQVISTIKNVADELGLK
mgnify:CR=1 FL=1